MIADKTEPGFLLCAHPVSTECLRVAYSPYYRGLMFSCTKNPHGCMSQDEGEYPTEESAQYALTWYRVRYAIEIAPAGSMDPRPCTCGHDPHFDWCPGEVPT